MIPSLSSSKNYLQSKSVIGGGAFLRRALRGVDIDQRRSAFTTHINTMKPSILNGRYPGKSHCRKVAEHLKSTLKQDVPTVLYLQGQTTRMQEDNDEAAPFRYLLKHNPHALS